MSILISALSAILPLSGAQGASIIYTPVKLIADQGISLKGWGSGTVSETDDVVYDGTRSIRISSRNFFQGGLLNFANPVDLKDSSADKGNLLRFAIRTADGGMTLGGGAPGGMPGGGKGSLGGPGSLGGLPGGGLGPGGRPGGLGQGAGPGGRPGGLGQGTGPGGRPGGFGPGQGGPGGFPGGGFPGGGMPSQTPPRTGIKDMRVVVTTTDGLKSEAFMPLPTSANDRGWKTVSVPLQAISGFDKTNKQISSLLITSDTTSTFYVGEIKVVNDTTPIQARINQQDMNLALGQEALFSASAQAGSSILRFTWDFDASDGIGVDAEGPAVRRRFRKAGTYTITLTVSDYFGLKDSYSTTIKAVVNP